MTRFKKRDGQAGVTGGLVAATQAPPRREPIARSFSVDWKKKVWSTLS